MIYLGNSPVGIAQKVGEFSQYAKVKKTFTTADNSTALLSFALSFEPKLIVFKSGASTNGFIVRGFLCFDYVSADTPYYGGIVHGKYTNGNGVGIQVFPKVSDTQPTAGNGKFEYYDGNMYVSRMSTLMYWSNVDEYTFECYG